MSDSDIVQDFLAESCENLDRLDRDLVGLEKNPHDKDALAGVFRTIHTIKGTCGFLGFNKLEKVAHVGENLLSRLRDGLLTLNPEITTALLSMVDAVRQMLKEIKSTGQDGDADYPELRETLTRLQTPAAASSDLAISSGPTPADPKVLPNSEASAPAPAKQDAPAGSAPLPTEVAPPAEARKKKDESPRKPARGKIGGLLVERGQVQASDIARALEEQEHGDRRRLGKILVALGLAKLEDVLAAQQTLDAKPRDAAPETIRVGVNLLDKLMTLVGELVLARNQLMQHTNTLEDTRLQAVSDRMNLIATELQGEVMKTRMQPIGNIWGQFPRTVRDVALGCGKEVNIEMEGKETELDKTIIEAIKDPLTHLVRNSVDHGIELPEDRVKGGKDRAGRLILRAFHEGGQVNIEISDDGAGLNPDRIRKKAVERAAITAEHAERMTEREIFNLIFLPGFSTAEKVTNVSGRGVGMDVVKTNVEKIGGTVDVQSTRGRGTTVRVKIPLTLAIIPALVVTCGGDRYAIPQVNLLELVRVEADQAHSAVEMVHGAPVYRLRGRLLPLVYLNRELEVEMNAQADREQPDKAVAASDLDFSLVGDKHRQWISTLQQVLEGKMSLTPQQAGSHEQCALGKWIYSVGLKEYGAIDDMVALEKTHKHFHELVHKVLLLKSAGDESLARQELEAVQGTSEQIMELTSSVEKRVLEFRNVSIVVLQADDRQFGLVVDEINDSEEIVVKPLRKQLKTVKTFAGSSIMGDGKVALILDVLGLAQRANVVTETRDRSLAAKAAEATTGAVEKPTFLLFAGPGGSRMAIPLCTLARLEEFPVSQVEMSGSQWVTQYRGQILPLVRLDVVLEERRSKLRALQGPPAADAGPIQVLVLNHEGHSFGLVVEEILDIVEDRADVRSAATRPAVLYSALINERVTELLDIPAILRSVESNALSANPGANSADVANHAVAQTSQFCTFYLDRLLFGVELKGVQEVIPSLDMTRVPLAPGVVSGLINLRGQIVTAVDLRRRLKLRPSPIGTLTTNVVVSSADGAVSLLVDEIGDVVEVEEATFEPPPETLRGPVRNVILGIHKLDDRLMHVLDIEKACQMTDASETAAALR
jgi:chemotaxis protein histidine kinase CheA